MLSLLDILFPDATMNLVKKLSPMKTIQPSINLWDTPKNIMVGQIGQLGIVPYGLTIHRAFIMLLQNVKITQNFFGKCKQCADSIQPQMVRIMEKQTLKK